MWEAQVDPEPGGADAETVTRAMPPVETGRPGRRRGRGRWILVVLTAVVGLAVVLSALSNVRMGSELQNNKAGFGAAARGEAENLAPSMPAEAPPAMDSADAMAGRGVPAPMPSLTQVGRTPSFARQIIKNADLSLEVSDLDEAMNRATEIVSRLGGLVVASNRGGGPAGRDGSRWASLTLRVPADRFDAAMVEMRRLGRVVAESQSTQDVTEEYIDLDARAVNLEEQERRLRALLGRAVKIEEIMQVENELARVRTEIDGLRGRQRFLADQAAYSTANLSMRETPLGAQQIESPGWKGVWQRAAAAFIRAVNGLLYVGASLVVVLAAALPVLLVLGALAALIWRLARWWRAWRASGS